MARVRRGSGAAAQANACGLGSRVTAHLASAAAAMRCAPSRPTAAMEMALMLNCSALKRMSGAAARACANAS